MKRLLIIGALAVSGLFGGLLGGLARPEHTSAQNPPNASYTYINTATTTTIKGGSGFLLSITVNGGTAGTVSLYDIAGNGCTGTPASGKFATIEAIGATNPTTLTYNLATKAGLCIVTAAASDVTVTWQ